MYLGTSSSVSKVFRKPFIDVGYRNGDLSTWNVFYSLFTFHNESMNIWSHLIGLICMIIAGISISIELFSKGSKFSEIFAVELYIVCASICFLLSAVYHWFGCLSELCHHCLLRFDLTGVALLVTGSFLPGVYYGILKLLFAFNCIIELVISIGFYCIPYAQQVHLILTGLVFFIGVSAPWLKFEYRGKNVRPFVYAFLVGAGLIPFTHWVIVTPSIIRAYFVKVCNCCTKNIVFICWCHFQGFLLMFFWYIVGFTFFITNVPECLFPKRFYFVLIRKLNYFVYFLPLLLVSGRLRYSRRIRYGTSAS